jgi:hypothetical protein
MAVRNETALTQLNKKYIFLKKDSTPTQQKDTQNATTLKTLRVMHNQRVSMPLNEKLPSALSFNQAIHYPESPRYGPLKLKPKQVRKIELTG